MLNDDSLPQNQDYVAGMNTIVSIVNMGNFTPAFFGILISATSATGVYSTHTTTTTTTTTTLTTTITSSRTTTLTTSSTTTLTTTDTTSTSITTTTSATSTTFTSTTTATSTTFTTTTDTSTTATSTTITATTPSLSNSSTSTSSSNLTTSRIIIGVFVSLFVIVLLCFIVRHLRIHRHNKKFATVSATVSAVVTEKMVPVTCKEVKKIDSEYSDNASWFAEDSEYSDNASWFAENWRAQNKDVYADLGLDNLKITIDGSAGSNGSEKSGTYGFLHPAPAPTKTDYIELTKDPLIYSGGSGTSTNNEYNIIYKMPDQSGYSFTPDPVKSILPYYYLGNDEREPGYNFTVEHRESIADEVSVSYALATDTEFELKMADEVPVSYALATDTEFELKMADEVPVSYALATDTEFEHTNEDLQANQLVLHADE